MTKPIILVTGATGNTGSSVVEQLLQRGYRHSIDWARFPSWAQPVDPQLYEGCCHEG